MILVGRNSSNLIMIRCFKGLHEVRFDCPKKCQFPFSKFRANLSYQIALIAIIGHKKVPRIPNF